MKVSSRTIFLSLVTWDQEFGDAILLSQSGSIPLLLAMDNRPNSQVLRDYENMQIHLKRGTFNFSMEHYNGQISVDKFDRAP